MKSAIAMFLVALMILPVLWRVRIMLERSAAARKSEPAEEAGTDGSPPTP